MCALNGNQTPGAVSNTLYLSNTLYSLKEGEKTRDAPHFSV